MSIEMIEAEEFNQGTQIKVIGVGGGGSNAVEHMIARSVQGVEFVCANTDAQALTRSSAHRIIQLGGSGLGAGSKPDKGRDAAEAAVEDIRAAIDGAHMFITAGMGGGTGTGAAPVIARVAKEMGIPDRGRGDQSPFDWEGGRRMQNADNGLAELEANVDSLIVVLNEKLLEVLGDDITQDEAFAHANDDVLKNAVGGIAEIINEYGQVNVDFEDVRTVMGEPGKAMMGTATASPGPRPHRRRAGHLPAARRHRPVGRQGRAGAGHGRQRGPEAVRVAPGHEHHQRLRFARRACPRHLRRRLRRQPGRRNPRDCGGYRPSRPNARRQPISVVQGGLRTGTDNIAYQMPVAGAMGAVGSAVGVAGGAQAADYGSMSVPSVWRTNRTQAAARVDALSSGGMDDLEIPRSCANRLTEAACGRAHGSAPWLPPETQGSAVAPGLL